MTAAANQPLLELAARAIAASIYLSEGLETMNYTGVEDYCNREWHNYAAEAQAALQACHVDEMTGTLKVAHTHALEMRDAWERGAISEHDGLGGTRSNRNVDVEVQLRSLLTKLGGKP